MRKKLDNISHGKPSAEPSSLKASQLSNTANIRTDVEKTKQNLKVVADKYMGQNSVRGFLTDIWAAFKISDVSHFIEQPTLYLDIPRERWLQP